MFQRITWQILPTSYLFSNAVREFPLEQTIHESNGIILMNHELDQESGGEILR